MSLASSDSEQVSLEVSVCIIHHSLFNLLTIHLLQDFLDSVRAPALFAELEDDEEIVEDDDENVDEQEYKEVMVSRNLLSMVRCK